MSYSFNFTPAVKQNKIKWVSLKLQINPCLCHFHFCKDLNPLVTETA